MQSAINELVKLGALPSSAAATVPVLQEYEKHFANVKNPLSDDEVRALIRLFGPDDCFGLAWTLLHLIEASPNWPIQESLIDLNGEWADRIRERIE